MEDEWKFVPSMNLTEVFNLMASQNATPSKHVGAVEMLTKLEGMNVDG